MGRGVERGRGVVMSDEGRDVRRDGLTLVVPCFVEVRRWWNHYFAGVAYRREAAGERIERGDKLGAGNAMSSILCWLATLSDADLERIEREGRAILDDLSRLPADYGRVPGRADPVTIPRRAESVLRPPSDPGPVQVAPQVGQPPPGGVEVLAANDRVGQHGTHQDQPPREPQRRPARRRR